MNDGIHLLAVELDGKDGLMMTFSDGTTGGYVVEELLQLRPIREQVEIKKIQKKSQWQRCNMTISKAKLAEPLT